ncbi:hypothetical protein SynRCC2555_00675 [Synechococcus sp. WH 8101]|nr:hypothetical protein SynRCC2555_00675 [Synechococcus sp. WH 8101]
MARPGTLEKERRGQPFSSLHAQLVMPMPGLQLSQSSLRTF